MQKTNARVTRLSPERWQEFRVLRTEASKQDVFQEPSFTALERDALTSVTPGWWRQTLEDCQSGNRHRWVFVEADGCLVAHGMVRCEQNPLMSHNAVVSQLFVDRLYRRRGIGTLVLRGLVRTALEELRAKNVLAEVASTDGDLIRLYEVNGFVCAGTLGGRIISRKGNSSQAIDVHHYVFGS